MAQISITVCIVIESFSQVFLISQIILLLVKQNFEIVSYFHMYCYIIMSRSCLIMSLNCVFKGIWTYHGIMCSSI